MKPFFYTPAQVAEREGLCRSAVYYYLKQGRITGAYRLGSRHAIPFNYKIINPHRVGLSVSEVAQREGLSPEAIYDRVREGRIRPVHYQKPPSRRIWIGPEYVME